VQRPASQTTLQLRAQLRRVDPVVWRRLLVPGAVHLGKLDLMLQAAMGWTNSHLHCFRIGKLSYGPKYVDDFDDDIIDRDEKTLTVSEAFEGERRLVYEYDFGDSWEHDVVVEDRLTSALALKFAVCLDGQNACPPEDCGGARGYQAMLESLADPSDDEHDSYLTWLGGPFDASAFSPAEANAALQRVR
jgi:hypothetical protein